MEKGRASDPLTESLTESLTELYTISICGRISLADVAGQLSSVSLSRLALTLLLSEFSNSLSN